MQTHKCQILFSEKNKKNLINLSSAELVQRVVKIKSILFLIKLPCQSGFNNERFHGKTGEFKISNLKTMCFTYTLKSVTGIIWICSVLFLHPHKWYYT